MKNFSIFLLTMLLIIAFYFSGTLQPKTSNDNLLLIKPSLSSLPFVSPIPTPVTPIVPSLPITRCLQLENHIPTERVVAISSDCHLNDFETQAREIARKYGDPDAANQFAPPFIPNTAKFYPLRIIGPDDRIKIYDTTIFPWTTIVKIEGQWDENSFFGCTGWMLGPSAVATAAHCIYNFTTTKTYAYNVTITPALNTDSVNPRPFGSCRILRGWVLTPWYNNGDSGYDYGVYDLSCRIGYQTGYLGLKAIPFK